MIVLNSLRIASLRSYFFVFAVVAAGEESELLVGMKNDGNPFVFQCIYPPLQVLNFSDSFPNFGCLLQGIQV